MSMPEQIRKQSETVKNLYEQLNKEAEGEASNTNDNVVDADTDDDARNDESVSSQRPAGSNDETMEQRYRTLQGMYNAEVPRLHQQNKELTRKLENMQQLIATMTTQQQQPQEETQKFISEKDTEDFGEETIDVIRRAAREEYAPYMQRLAQLENMLNNVQQNVMPRLDQVQQHQAMSAEQQFWSGLQQAIPNWKEINSNQNFHAWLLEVDPLFDMKRQDVLQQAQQNLDLNRVITFFRTWMNQAGYSDNDRGSKNTQGSQLEKQIAPGRSRSGPAPTASNKRTYTRTDIQSFFDDVRKGKYKGREKERDRIERDIFAAQSDGRITA